MAVPYTFGTATASIPLSQLDSNFATVITLGNTAIQLGNTVTTLNNMTLANVTISSGNVTLTNVTITTANVTTANVVTLIVTGNETVQGNTTVTGTITGAKLIPTGSSVTGNGMYLPAANSVGISTNGTNAVYIDSNQNVGLGVTPSAWTSGQKVIQAGNTTAVMNDGSKSTYYGNNFYYNGGFKYLTTGGAATYYTQDASGAHTWYSYAAATAGATLTGGAGQAMTLDSTGDLALGRTSVTPFSSGYRTLDMDGTNGSGVRLRANGTTEAYLYCSTTSSILGTLGADPLVFETNGTERARINSSGDLLVGTTTTQGKLTVEQSTTGTDVAVLRNTSASPYGIFQRFTGADPNNTTNYVFSSYYNTTNIYTIWSNGTVTARSDGRFKKNIETARNGYAEDLSRLRVVKYNWYNHEDNSPKELGLIAQEVEQVFPNLVMTENVGEETESKSIKTSVLPIMLLKAMQEQQALITQLTARVAQLESKP